MAFTPRLTDANMVNNPWWYSKQNPLYDAGYGLPNCTCYAYGRYAEIRGAFANLPVGNAGKWFEQATSFDRGQTPRLGAIMVWKDTESPNLFAGHVAVVEGFASDGGIICSNSAWQGTYFWTATVYASNQYRMSWMLKNGRHYGFMGFIYNDSPDTMPDPGDITDPALDAIPDGEWQAKRTGGYAMESNEAWNNACRIYHMLRSAVSDATPNGWTLNAICALLGNIDAESSYNPWQWESDNILPQGSDKRFNSSGPGYGLVQWTPASGYLDNPIAQANDYYAPNDSNQTGRASDGFAQIVLMNQTTGSGPYQQWYSTKAFTTRYANGERFTGMTWNDFRNSKDTPERLAEAFVICYERPGYQRGTKIPLLLRRRINAARYWYNKFVNYASSNTPPKPEEPEDEPGNEPGPEPEPPENPGEETGPEEETDPPYPDYFAIKKRTKGFIMIGKRRL